MAIPIYKRQVRDELVKPDTPMAALSEPVIPASQGSFPQLDALPLLPGEGRFTDPAGKIHMMRPSQPVAAAQPFSFARPTAALTAPTAPTQQQQARMPAPPIRPPTLNENAAWTRYKRSHMVRPGDERRVRDEVRQENALRSKDYREQRKDFDRNIAIGEAEKDRAANLAQSRIVNAAKVEQQEVKGQYSLEREGVRADIAQMRIDSRELLAEKANAVKVYGVDAKKGAAFAKLSLARNVEHAKILGNLHREAMSDLAAFEKLAAKNKKPKKSLLEKIRQKQTLLLEYGQELDASARSIQELKILATPEQSEPTTPEGDSKTDQELFDMYDAAVKNEKDPDGNALSEEQIARATELRDKYAAKIKGQ